MATTPSKRARPPAEGRASTTGRAGARSTAPSAKGRFERQVSGTDAVEVKATLDDDHIRAGMKHLGLAPEAAERRHVYFFDTPKLDLFQAGVIVRARRIPGSDHDSTIKIRPVRAEVVPAKWQDVKGFKLEADAGETSIVRSASLSRSVEKGLIKEVVAGNVPLTHLFTKAQEQFLKEMCRIRHPLAGLTMLGPVDVLWWKIAHAGVPVPMTAELWTRGDKAQMLEASIRVPSSQAAFANSGFLAFLAEVGAERENAQQAKTRWVLQYYASRIEAGARATPKPAADHAKQPATKIKRAVRKHAKARSLSTPTPAANEAGSGSESPTPM
jgi:hypothetical protein